MNKIKKNILPIIKQWGIIIGTVFSLLSIGLSFVSWDDLGILQISIKMGIFAVIIVMGFLAAIIWICFFRKNNQIWSGGAGKINVCYGNLMKIAFPKKSGKEKIIVIPVNTSFDTIVDENLASVNKPLVSSTTIHGKWIKEMGKHGINVSSIDSGIENFFYTNHISPCKELSVTEKQRGNRKVFDKGTVVIINGNNNAIFFLLAISEFDEDNRACSSKEEIIESLKKLLSFYNSRGQGYELYLPLMGVGRSRAGLTHEESLQTIKSVLLLYRQEIQGKINIVVYTGDMDKVSIFD